MGAELDELDIGYGLSTIDRTDGRSLLCSIESLA